MIGYNASSSKSRPFFVGLHLEKKMEALGKFVQLSQAIHTPLKKSMTKGISFVTSKFGSATARI